MENYDEMMAIEDLQDYLSLLQSGRSFDEELLETLDEYPLLSNHFRSRMDAKLEREDYHPFFYILRDDRPELDFLEDNWEKIPESKRNGLLNTSIFSDYFSEIKFLVAIGKNGVDCEVDVPLTHFNTGEVIGDVDLVIDGAYIDLLRPETWRDLSLSNQPKFIPNNAERKILSKFKDKYLGASEVAENPIFLALDLEQTEIQRPQVEEALHGSLQIQIFYDQETGEVADEKLTRDPDERLKGKSEFLDKHLNGVIWFKTRLTETEEGVQNDIELGVVPNPECEDQEDNIELCEELENELLQLK